MDKLHEIELIVFPVEVISSARVPVLKVSASIPKNDQTAVGSECDSALHQVALCMVTTLKGWHLAECHPFDLVRTILPAVVLA
jgi:hypothetical protein